MFGDLDVKVKPDATIGASTYFKIGGQADALVHPRSADSLSLLLQRCHNEEIPFRVLGSRRGNLVVVVTNNNIKTRAIINWFEY